MNKYKKEQILKQIDEVETVSGRNSMGVSENYYNKYYLLKDWADNQEVELSELSEAELNMLLDLASYAGDMFY